MHPFLFKPHHVPLLDLIALGNKTALKTLYDDTAPCLLGVLIEMTGDRSVAENLLADLFVTIWNRPGDFRPTPTPQPHLAAA
jgi:RNA polymerase sigma-70 factor, ECF subfamily